MKHISKLTKELEAMPAKAYIPKITYPEPNCLPLGYIEGIQSGGGSIFEVFYWMAFDQLCGIGIKE